MRKEATHLGRVAPTPPSRSAADESPNLVGVLPSMDAGECQEPKSMRRTRKGYAKFGIFFVTSITLLEARFTLLKIIGSLNPPGVTLITLISDLWVTSYDLDHMDKYVNETVTVKRELFLANPCKKHQRSLSMITAENGSSGVNTVALKSSPHIIMTQNPSCTVLGACLPLLSGGTGRNSMGAKKAPSEFVRTRGASLCHPSTRDAVKAIPEIQTVKWVPTTSFANVAMETLTLPVELSWCKPTSDETGQPRNVVPTFRGWPTLVKP